MTPKLLMLALAGLTAAGCATPPTPQAIRPVGGHGAIAYAESTRKWQVGWAAADPQMAAATVLRDCGGAACRVILTFGPGQCGTLALRPASPTPYTGLGVSAPQAEVAALALCRADGARDCRVAPARCNT